MDSVHTLEMLFQVVFSGEYSLGWTFTVAVGGITFVGNVGVLFVHFFTIYTLPGTLFILAFWSTYPLVEDEMNHLFVTSPVSKVCKVRHAEGTLVYSLALVVGSGSLALSKAEDLLATGF
jgi:hypothetical protein